MSNDNMVKEDVLKYLLFRYNINSEKILNKTASNKDIYLTNEAISIADVRLGKHYTDKIQELIYPAYGTHEENLNLTNIVLDNIILDIKNNLSSTNIL